MATEQTATLDAPEDEVLLGESVSDEARRIRVYDQNGDFIIEVPAKAKITFGYFNPSIAGDRQVGRDPWGAGADGRNVIKTTALRIYEAGEKSNQLACFIGIKGFRDLRVKKTKLVQRVVVERRYTGDGEGNEEWDGKRQAELTVGDEDQEIAF
jgi:hypothetical protein